VLLLGYSSASPADRVTRGVQPHTFDVWHKLGTHPMVQNRTLLFPCLPSAAHQQQAFTDSPEELHPMAGCHWSPERPRSCLSPEDHARQCPEQCFWQWPSKLLHW